MDESFLDEEQDRIQKALNEEFERQFENAKRISIRELLGSPTFRSIDEIPPEKLEAEVDRVLELLSRIDVVVDCLADVPDADLYRFLTTELVNEEIDDIKIEGMKHCFIYEEFHPNDEYDAKSSAEHFLRDLEGEYARVTLQGRWSGLKAGLLEPVSHKGECVLKMKKSPYGGYDLIQANIPGFIAESSAGESP